VAVEGVGVEGLAGLYAEVELRDVAESGEELVSAGGEEEAEEEREESCAVVERESEVAAGFFTTETQRTQRKHREADKYSGGRGSMRALTHVRASESG
jgi:hypothetical protein